MFNKNKKPNEIKPADKSTTAKSGVLVNKNATSKPNENKSTKQEKSAMRSEGGKN